MEGRTVSVRRMTLCLVKKEYDTDLTIQSTHRSVPVQEEPLEEEPEEEEKKEEKEPVKE